MLPKFLRIATFFMILLVEACIPKISKSFMQSVSDFLQLRSLISTGPFQITVRVSGLVGSGLVLNLNSGRETITANADGNYQFSTAFTTGQDFALTIQSQPVLPSQTCSVSGGTGVVGYGNIATIIVNCDPLRYTLGGTISGLDGIGFTLTNSYDGSTLPVAVASGTFAFTQTYEAGTPYNVTVATQPNHPVQDCLISNGSNTFPANNVTTIAIICTSTAYPIEITAIGISSGSLTLSNNGSETIVISSDGLHRFPTNLAPSSTYNVQIVSAPTNHQCVLSSNAGTIVGTVSIQANCFSLNYDLSTPRNGGILLPNESLRLVFTAEINAGSCVGSSGSLTTTALGLPVQFAVSTTNITNDTLVVTPAVTDSWQAGHRNLNLLCTTNLGAVPLAASTSLFYLIPSDIRYVSASALDDSGDGMTVATAKRNIQAGIDSFSGCGSNACAVLVAQGSYDPAFAGGRIQLESGISLFGSYDPGFTTRQPTLKTSTIQMVGVPAYCAGSTDTNPCVSVAADATVTSPVVVSGFTILSGDSAPYMAGVFLDGTNSVRLIDNSINAGKGTASSYGVLAINSSPYLVLNQISGGDCTNLTCYSAGVKMTSSAVINPVIIGNTIDSGKGDGDNVTSRGIFYEGSVGFDVSNIRQNIVSSSNLDNTSLTSTTNSIAFDVTSLSASSIGILAGNQFIAGTGNRSIGIRISAPTGIQIGSATVGNIISTGAASYTSTGIYLSTGHLVRNNLIQLGSTANTNATYVYGIEIGLGGATATILRNTILGGNATSGASAVLNGIYAVSLNAASSISMNYIRLGSANGTSSTLVSGINLQSPAGLLVSNNWIQNGSSNVHARGINISGVFNPLRIYHNTINSGTSSVIGNEAVIQINSNTSVLIENNILLLNTNAGSNVCVRNNGGLQGSIRSNVFHNCTNMAYQSLNFFTDLCPGGIPGAAGLACAVQLGLAPNFGENLNLNPNLVSQFGVVASYIPTSATSCQITRATNNILADSFNGIGNRPGGDGAVSIGAIEYDLPCTP